MVPEATGQVASSVLLVRSKSSTWLAESALTEGGLVAMITILAVAFYGFYVSRAGKPVFETAALDL